MNRIAIPAAIGNEAIGFLVGLGVLTSVTEDVVDTSARLGWPDGPRNPAVLESSTIGDLDDLAALLAEVAEATRASGVLLPGATPGMPPRKQGKENDPTRRVEFAAARDWCLSAVEDDNDPRFEHWLLGLFATDDVARDRDGLRTGHVHRSPMFDAGPGSMSMSGLLTGAVDVAADGQVLGRSLRGLNRTSGEIGGYLDWRADRDAASSNSRQGASNLGDPGLAWLAYMGIRTAPLVTVDGRAQTALHPPSMRGLRKALRWPVWRRALPLTSVRVLLSHPSVDGRPEHAEACIALGVDAVFAAPRVAKANNDGAYGPAHMLWRSEIDR